MVMIDERYFVARVVRCEKMKTRLLQRKGRDGTATTTELRFYIRLRRGKIGNRDRLNREWGRPPGD